MFGELISGGAKLFEGFMNREATKENNERLQQNAALDRKLQMDFAQHGISWKVQDALDAGVHPLAALGASSSSYSPVSVGTSAATMSGLGDMGADIGRAVNATMTKTDKVSAAGKAAQALTLEKGALENELLRTEIASQTAKLTQAGGNPSMPNPGQKTLLDGQGATTIAEDKKFKDRPKMQYGGRKILTDPLTSNVESAEDRYGDEGPAQWAAQMATAWNDFKYNVNQGNLTRADVAEWIGNQAKFLGSNARELKAYMSPARTIFRSGRR